MYFIFLSEDIMMYINNHMQEASALKIIIVFKCKYNWVSKDVFSWKNKYLFDSQNLQKCE